MPTNSPLDEWVRSSGLPSPDEIEHRITAARPPGTPGPRTSVATITRALAARRWRKLGYTVREVAIGLADDPLRGLARTDRPIEDPVRERRALKKSRVPAEKEAAALEQRLKRDERVLRRLEAAEDKPSPEPVRDAPARQREADSYTRGLRLRDRHCDLLARVKNSGVSPDDDPECLLAEAAVIEHRADSRPEARGELLAIVHRLRSRAALLQKAPYASTVTVRRVPPGADPNDPCFDPFSAPVDDRSSPPTSGRR